MAEEVFPSVRILARDARTVEVHLPDDGGTMYPTIPESLHGKELPAFVLEWLVESDEVGMIIQEILQAPTQSLCRIMPLTAPQRGGYKSGYRRYGYNRYMRRGGGFGGSRLPPFRGLSDEGAENLEADADAPDLIEGLPVGIDLPADLLDHVEAANRVNAWVEKGYRVREWLEEEGIGEQTWLPENPNQ